MIRSIAGAVWGNCNRHSHSQACALGCTLFRQIVELVQLAGKLDWDWLDGEIAQLYNDKGRPGSRLSIRHLGVVHRRLIGAVISVSAPFPPPINIRCRGTRDGGNTGGDTNDTK